MATDTGSGALAAAERWRGALAGATGWRRRGLAVALGAGAALMLPPVHAVPVLLAVFPGLLWLIGETGPGAGRGERFKRGFWTGWWFGVGFFAAGLYWLAFPFLVDAATYGWMIPFALAGLSTGLAIFTAAAVGLTALSARGAVARALMLAVWWVVLEWLRGWILTGFPWNFAGTAWTFSPAMLQFAAVAGVFGLGLITVAAAAMPAVLGESAIAPRRRIAIVAAAFAGVAAVWAGGAVRLSGAEDSRPDGVRLRLVQPNVAQKDKWVRGERERHIRLMIDLSRADAAGAPPTHVIWPETAVTFFLEREPELREALAAAVPPGGALITGAVRAEIRDNRIQRIWNSLHTIDGDGGIVATYDKAHLVPFGEYMPFGEYLPVTKLTGGRVDFSAGPGLVTQPVPGAPPFSPLICYEATFAGDVVPRVPRGRGDTAQWMLNVTNDAWLGASSGPFQHFASARMRAVEEGLPMVRVANTGISAVVDSYGRIVDSLGLGETGIVDAALPRPTPGATPFARFGNVTALVLVLAAALLAWVCERRIS
jgi:apolipoprotein N-acyltransferase